MEIIEKSYYFKVSIKSSGLLIGLSYTLLKTLWTLEFTVHLCNKITVLQPKIKVHKSTDFVTQVLLIKMPTDIATQI